MAVARASLEIAMLLSALKERNPRIRRSDERMTERYTHADRQHEIAALEKVPELDAPESQKATGTDGKPAVAISTCTSTWTKQDDSPGLTRTNPDGMLIQTENTEISEVPVKQEVTRMGRGGVEPPTHEYSVHSSTCKCIISK